MILMSFSNIVCNFQLIKSQESQPSAQNQQITSRIRITNWLHQNK